MTVTFFYKNYRSVLLSAIMMTTIATYWSTASAQNLETEVTLSAGSGYASNSYLIPMIPEWERRYISAFTTFTPSARMRYAGSGRSITVNGIGQLLHFYDERPTWGGGYLTTTFRQRLSSSFTARASGGLGSHATSYNRDLQWLQLGVDWLATSSTRLEATAGSGWRTIRNLENMDDMTDRFTTYSLGIEYWPSFRWRLRMNFNSNLDHLSSPGDGFSSTVSATNHRFNGLVLMLETGLEQYTVAFQSSRETETGSTDNGLFNDDENTLNIQNRFHRTTFRASYPVSGRITLTGTVAGLLWFSSADDEIEPDYQISAGIQVPFSLRRVRSGELRSLDFESERSGRTTLTVRYRGDANLYITGDFNDWEDPGIPLRKTNRNRYSVALDLSVGMHQFKIAKRENDELEWLELPDDAPTVNDGFGGKNGRIIIDY